MKSLFSFFIFLLLSSCFLNTWDSRLTLSNKTTKKIFFRYNFKEKGDYKLDTTNCSRISFYDLEGDSEQRLPSQNKYDVYFRMHPNNFLRIYIIDSDSLNKYGPCQILKEQIFAKRFDLNYDDMVKLDWRVEYKE